jgi:DNA invertase Pin-like site-specific DNA recombinase
MTKKKNIFAIEKRIALCYVRQSVTRDGDDNNSPERQRANIQAMCEQHDWIPEWYEDVDGHRSGRNIKNRPGWLALIQRIGDPDVVALIANDLARLHRKGWRVGDMLEHLEQQNVALLLAAPGREIDTSTPLGKIFVQFTAMFDEYYAEDISQRAKDSVAYRKSLGKTIGAPPFGTIRNKEGYLIPSPYGAWFLPDKGRFVAGEADQSPMENAVWRGYYQAAERILTAYVESNMGLHKVAYLMNAEHWAFEDRKATPRPITEDDIRRVIASWGVYGGLTTHRKSKDYKAYKTMNIEEIPFREKRAVFPVDLLREVARIRQARSIAPTNDGKKRETRFYPLSQMTFCAHCDQLAQEHDDPRLRTALSGASPHGIRRYRHKHGVSCGCTAKSVPCDQLEDDFKRLIGLLTIEPSMLDDMTELAIQADAHFRVNSDVDPQKEKEENIALCQRRINAAVQLYGDGYIDMDEYKRRVEKNERELAHWQTRTTEVEKVGLELAMCIEVLSTITRLWDMSDEEDKQGMAQNLFTELVVNLDTQRIVSFKLKPWAERFLVVRASLYEDEPTGDITEKSSVSSSIYPMPHTGFEPVFSA